ncbi:MAG: hypothetical protein NT074_00450 [Methanomicrobiales archaeon]|nr:hypothetical protein [Methanomicrobiales archaeon]
MAPRIFCILLAGLLCLSGIASAMSSTNFDLSWNTISNGGGQATSTAFKLDGTIGQLAGMSSSTSYTLVGGFWGGSGSSGGSAPTITTFTPTSAMVNAAPFNLTLTGTNFTAGNRVTWNGADRTTYYTSATSLKAWITAPDLAAAGSNNISVRNADGGLSINKTFNVTNPIPTATSLNPTNKGVF